MTTTDVRPPRRYARTVATDYFVSERTGALLRRQGGTDEVYVVGTGGWQPTETILNYMVGDDNDVEPITEAEARLMMRPAAF